MEYAVPILPSKDLHETLEFYERLGFENRGAPPEEWDPATQRTGHSRAGLETRHFAH